MSGRINHLAVIVAAIVYFGFGYLWYGLLFSGLWTSYMGKSMGGALTPVQYGESFLLGLLLSYAAAMALSRRPEDLTVSQGISFAIFMGLLLYGTQTLNHAIYENIPFGLWVIDTGYVVIGFAIIGAIVGGWKSGAKTA